MPIITVSLNKNERELTFSNDSFQTQPLQRSKSYFFLFNGEKKEITLIPKDKLSLEYLKYKEIEQKIKEY